MNLSEYFHQYAQQLREPAASRTKIRIAILADSTLNGLKEVLSVKCSQQGIAAEIQISAYNQIHQEVLDERSALYKFAPDLVILFTDLRSVAGDYYFFPYEGTEADRRSWAEQKTADIHMLVGRIRSGSAAKILVHNWEVPTHSPSGILEHKEDFGFLESVQAVNVGLRSAYKKDPRVFLFDYDGFCSRVGKDRVLDRKMYYLADTRLAFPHLITLAEAYMGYIKPFFGLTKKCLVLDLDNTLWGGVVGEDGLEGIRLGPSPEGRPYFEFQKHVLAVQKRGILLAINSRNNAEEALKVIREHPHMVLRENCFSAVRINWQDKVANLRSIAKDLNIGLESLVFVDDDRVNCGLVRAALPEVRVVELPEDAALYSQTFLELDDFNVTALTEEDGRRSALYEQEKSRRDSQQTATSVDEYLSGLGTKIIVQKSGALTLPRISQLVLKTNQFNMTTRRYSEEKMSALASSPHHLLLAFRVIDRFGDSGITGAAIVEKAKGAWRIDNLILSCRVIGRKIEHAIFSHLLETAKKEEVQSVVGEFIPSEKNAVAKDFYGEAGFVRAADDGAVQKWTYDTARSYPKPKFITLLEESDER